MDITGIRLRNFKCFQDSQEIPLAPLTVIFGRNNTGKSSILQSLFLLRQSLDSPDYRPRLNLSGDLYAAGTYKDVVHQHESSSHVSMDLAVRLDNNREGKVELQFTQDEPHPPRLTRLRVEGGGVERVTIERSVGKGGPYELTIGDNAIGGEKKANFRFNVNQFFPLIGDEPPHIGRPNKARDRSRKFARDVLEGLEKSLRSIRAVGAFRTRPSRRYDYQGYTPYGGVDATGENVISALIADSIRRGRRGKLLASVNKWLKLLGRVRILKLRPIAKTKMYELRLKDTDSGRWANFADVGFGIGQALPVLVEGLISEPGDIFIVQEPEIHLHPDAQLAMADFLIDLVRSGRRVIAETHSDNLLLRIRREIAKSNANGASQRSLQPEDVRIIYVEKSADGPSHTTTLKTDAMGQINNWPKGFMEEATQERIDILGLIS